ncbi:MAG: DUF512 domain-containing protein [Oscillospiraceae bacterium]|nr:DUF512 domain-containing protein [Oscillospiraceae bacterium]
MTKIINVIKNSPAYKAGIKSGDVLISINGHEIADVLDYMYYSAENKLQVKISNQANAPHGIVIKKREYEDLGLEFETFLMDKSRNCQNKCVFCFIDQLPKGLRETLYFKDDDSRLSFLQGNYISLTNLTEREVGRIIKMKLGVHVSVHTTNKALRCQMLGNPSAGSALEHLYKMADAGIEIHGQVVLCPGINDGAELERTLTDLTKLSPAVRSIACVPVGLTKYREGLAPLKPFDRDSARAALEIIGKYSIASASDELFLTAERELPGYEYYGGEERDFCFPQYENGVGMLALLQEEFRLAVHDTPKSEIARKKSLATGVSAAPFLEKLVKFCDANVQIYAIENKFFGNSVTVAGLVTGGDLIKQLSPHKNSLGEELLIPSVMLRAGGDVFLDDITVGDVENALGVKVRVLDVDGAQLYDALMD